MITVSRVRSRALPWALLSIAASLAGCAVDRSGLGLDGAPPPPPDAAGIDAAVIDAAGIDAGAEDGGPPPDGCIPAVESCDGADEDCDGSIDEDVTRDCSTACGAGVETCTAGSFGGCSAPPIGAESCNGVDEDCDGSVDESLSRACSTACGSGTETCDAGSWIGCTAPPVGTETCNGVDDDCDGPVDESLSRACSTACGSGTETCDAGSWIGCTAPPAPAETCNATDDDCDGAIDEAPATCGCRRATNAGRTYLFCTTDETWANARTYCTTRGYDLVTIGGPAEDAFVQMAAFMTEDNDWWIGLARSSSATDGFAWADGSTASYRNWGTGSGGGATEPNNIGGEECVMFENGSTGLEDDGQWADRECAETRPFVCEAP